MGLTSTQKKEKNVVELEISVGAEELKEAANKVYVRKRKTITVPGFRKGKAPRNVIEKMYGEGIFLQDAVDELFPGAYEAAVEEAGIEPVDRAEMEMLLLDKEEGFRFKATVTVKPEITVGTYKGLQGEKVISAVADEAIDNDLSRMQEQNARLVPVEDRPAADGDIVIIDFEGFTDGEAFEGGTAADYELTLGSNQFIEGFEEQIVGKNTGDAFEVNVTFPDEYHTEELQGKPAVFKVELKEIQVKELPELDDEFAKDVSEFDTIQELRDDITEKHKQAQETRSKNDLENGLISQVIDTIEDEIPACMFEQKTDDLVRDFGHRIRSQGMELEMYLQYTGMEFDTFRDSFRPEAERQVKIRLALEAIAAKEGFTATDEEYEAELERLSTQHGIELEQVRNMLSRKDVETDLLCGKALDLIRESATVTEITAEEKQQEKQEKDEKKTEKKADKKTEKKAKAEKKPALKAKPKARTTTKAKAKPKAKEAKEEE